MSEIWAPIEGYEGVYEVSSLGRVRSLDREVVKTDAWGREYTCVVRGIMRKIRRRPSGYNCVMLCVDGVRHLVDVHRLVASAFIPNPCGKHEVNHIDGNKANNQVENLEWCDRVENVRHARDVLKHSSAHPKLSPSQVKRIRSSSESARSLAKRFGVSSSTVDNARNYKTYKEVI